MTRKVFVDSDTGVDDALALMLLAAAPEVEVMAVGSVFGNCHADRAADNARYVLDTCARPDIPVYRGSDAPLGQELRLSGGIHGEDGFGNTGLRPAEPVPGEPDAVSVLSDLVERHPGQIHYLALGPLTNLARALQQDPRLMDRLASVTIVGSLGPALHGDTEPWADRRFRISRDPNVAFDFTAARIVADTPGPMTWCGPYVTRQCLVPEQYFTGIAERTGHEPARLIARISEYYADFYTRSYPQPGGARVMGINDSLAAACLLYPELMLGAVDRVMETFETSEGERYLAGVHVRPDDPRPVHRVVFDVDFDAVISLAGETLERPLPWT